DAALARGEQHVQCAAGVGLEVLARVSGRGDDAAGREMEHELMAGHELAHGFPVGDRAMDECRPGRHGAGTPCGEVVENADLRSALAQAFGDCPANEPRSAGDEDSAPGVPGRHRLTPVASRATGRSSRIHENTAPVFDPGWTSWNDTVTGTSTTRC